MLIYITRVHYVRSSHHNGGNANTEHGDDCHVVPTEPEGNQGEAVGTDQVPEAVRQENSPELPFLK